MAHCPPARKLVCCLPRLVASMLACQSACLCLETFSLYLLSWMSTFLNTFLICQRFYVNIVMQFSQLFTYCNLLMTLGQAASMYLACFSNSVFQLQPACKQIYFLSFLAYPSVYLVVYIFLPAWMCTCLGCISFVPNQLINSSNIAGIVRKIPYTCIDALLYIYEKRLLWCFSLAFCICACLYIDKSLTEFCKLFVKLNLCKIWQNFDEIIDNKVPISQKFHEIFANVLSLVFFFCNHQVVLYRMTQKLNVWGLWCVFSVFRQNIWYIQFVAYSIFYQSSIFLYWEECWKKQVVKKYNL